MTTRLSVIDRIIILLIALCLGAVAAVLIGAYAGAQWADQAIDAVPFSTFDIAPGETPWWIMCAVLIAVGLLIGFPLLIANLRTHRFSRGDMSQESIARAHESVSASQQIDGGIAINLQDFATAVAKDLENQRGVEKVRRKVFLNNHQPTIDFTVTAQPLAVKQGLFSALENSRRSLEDALPEHRLEVRYALSLTKNKEPERELN